MARKNCDEYIHATPEMCNNAIDRCTPCSSMIRGGYCRQPQRKKYNAQEQFVGGYTDAGRVPISNIINCRFKPGNICVKKNIQEK
jgi:hypothetical protein